MQVDILKGFSSERCSFWNILIPKGRYFEDFIPKGHYSEGFFIPKGYYSEDFYAEGSLFRKVFF